MPRADECAKEPREEGRAGCAHEGGKKGINSLQDELQIAVSATDDILLANQNGALRRRAWGNSVSEKEQSEEKPQSNLARLQGHLKEGCLAAELVAARIAAGDGDPYPLLRKAMLDRIDALKAKHDPVQN
jgi:hypothetical protein